MAWRIFCSPKSAVNRTQTATTGKLQPLTAGEQGFPAPCATGGAVKLLGHPRAGAKPCGSATRRACKRRRTGRAASSLGLVHSRSRRDTRPVPAYGSEVRGRLAQWVASVPYLDSNATTRILSATRERTSTRFVLNLPSLRLRALGGFSISERNDDKVSFRLCRLAQRPDD